MAAIHQAGSKPELSVSTSPIPDSVQSKNLYSVSEIAKWPSALNYNLNACEVPNSYQVLPKVILDCSCA